MSLRCQFTLSFIFQAYNKTVKADSQWYEKQMPS